MSVGHHNVNADSQLELFGHPVMQEPALSESCLYIRMHIVDANTFTRCSRNLLELVKEKRQRNGLNKPSEVSTISSKIHIKHSDPRA
jgi:hypothetical protein